MEAGYDDNLFLAGYGVRVTNGDLAAELLFIRPLGEDVEPVVGLPMLTLTVRAR
jgi:hypothetical protein